jgi:hypothetical protein
MGEATSRVILEASDTRRRLVQQLVPLAGAALLIGGVLLAAMGEGAIRVAGFLLVAASIASFAIMPRARLDWEVSYKGHVIRFENHPVFGERLFIDDRRISSGAFGYRKTLEGTIRGGEGDGDRIVAESRAGVLAFDVRLSAEEQSTR